MVAKILSEICNENDFVLVDTSSFCYEDNFNQPKLDSLLFKKNVLENWVNALERESFAENVIITNKIFGELNHRNSYNYKKSIKYQNNSKNARKSNGSVVYFKRLVRDSAWLQKRLNNFFELNPERRISFEGISDYIEVNSKMRNYISLVDDKSQSFGKRNLSETDMDLFINALILSRFSLTSIISNDNSIKYLFLLYSKNHPKSTKNLGFYFLSEPNTFKLINCK